MGIHTRDSLVEILTTIAFTSSVVHHALNAPHHIYSYAPHRPTLMRKWMPDWEGDITWEWIKDGLPSLTETAAVYDIANMLAKPSLCTLTQLPSPGPQFQDIHHRFLNKLERLSWEVRRRNHPYDYLDPQNIACSIDI